MGGGTGVWSMQFQLLHKQLFKFSYLLLELVQVYGICIHTLHLPVIAVMIIGVSSCVESSARKWFLTACYFYRCHCVYVGTLSSWWSRLIIRVNSVATNHSWTELTKTTDLSCIIRRSSFYCPLGILEKVLVCTVSGTMMLVPASLAVPSLILICVCVCSYIGRCILLCELLCNLVSSLLSTTCTCD